MSNPYLDAKVRTASQPELQIMLLESAIRQGTEALDRLAADEASLGGLPMQRMLDLLEALVSGFSDGTNELSKSLEDQFAFLFRETAVAQFNADAQRLARVLDLLGYHRETLHLAWEKCRADRSPAPAVAEASPGRPAKPLTPLPAPTWEAGGFSLQA